MVLLRDSRIRFYLGLQVSFEVSLCPNKGKSSATSGYDIGIPGSSLIRRKPMTTKLLFGINTWLSSPAENYHMNFQSCDTHETFHLGELPSP